MLTPKAVEFLQIFEIIARRSKESRNLVEGLYVEFVKAKSEFEAWHYQIHRCYGVNTLDRGF